jgi:hypothetical protein
MQATVNGCRPDSVFVIFRDYYLLVYVLHFDILVEAVVGKKVAELAFLLLFTPAMYYCAI